MPAYGNYGPRQVGLGGGRVGAAGHGTPGILPPGPAAGPKPPPYQTPGFPSLPPSNSGVPGTQGPGSTGMVPYGPPAMPGMIPPAPPPVMRGMPGMVNQGPRNMPGAPGQPSYQAAPTAGGATGQVGRPTVPPAAGAIPAPQPGLGNQQNASASAGRPGQMTVQPYSTPQGVFNPADTEAGVNQAWAQAHKAANPEFLQKQFDRPGVSRGPAQMQHVVPQMGEALARGAQQAAQIPWQDEMANQQNLLQGQQRQAGAANQLAGIGAGMGDDFNNWLASNYGIGQQYQGLGQDYRGLGQQQLGLNLGDQGFAAGNQMQQQQGLMGMLQQLFGQYG